MKCCILLDDGTIKPFPEADGSQEVEYELGGTRPKPMNKAGARAGYATPAAYTRHPVPNGQPLAGYLYAQSTPTNAQLRQAREVLQAMTEG